MILAGDVGGIVGEDEKGLMSQQRLVAVLAIDPVIGCLHELLVPRMIEHAAPATEVAHHWR